MCKKLLLSLMFISTLAQAEICESLAENGKQVFILKEIGIPLSVPIDKLKKYKEMDNKKFYALYKAIYEGEIGSTSDEVYTNIYNQCYINYKLIGAKSL